MYGPHLSDYDIHRICCVKSHHTEAFDSSDFLFASCEDPHTHSKCDQYTQINDVFRNDADGTDGGSDTQNHQDVKYVRTDGVTQCHIDFIFSGCNDGSHKLRKRCTDGNDGKSDQRLRHSQVACDSGCSIDGEISAEGNRSSTADNENNAKRHGDQLDLFIGTALNFYFFSFLFAFKAILIM